MPSLIGHDLRWSITNGKGTTDVLRGISLDLHAGQFAVLMGRSGSGKTTLMSVLSGLLRPTIGAVRSQDRDGSLVDLWSLSDEAREQFRLRNFGFVFQGFNLFPALTALEQLEVVLRWGEGVSARKARQRADEVLAALDLPTATRRQRPAELSGGEKQRVAIGRALVKKPAFCFADEPTSALDDENGLRAVGLMRDLARKDKTTLLVVTHDKELLPLADDIFTMRNGTLAVEQSAPAAEESGSCWQL